MIWALKVCRNLIQYCIDLTRATNAALCGERQLTCDRRPLTPARVCVSHLLTSGILAAAVMPIVPAQRPCIVMPAPTMTPKYATLAVTLGKCDVRKSTRLVENPTFTPKLRLVQNFLLFSERPGERETHTHTGVSRNQ